MILTKEQTQKIASRIASSTRTLVYVRMYEHPLSNPNEVREAYEKWVADEIERTLEEQ